MSSTPRDLPGLAAEMLRGGNKLHIRAQGWSMYPFIKHGDILEVEPREISGTKVGDVVLCRYGAGKLVAHRVVGVNREDGGVALVVKGDWTPRADPLVYPEQVLGRVAAIERGEKRIRLNSGTRRLVEVLWTRISPHSRWICFPLRKAVHNSHRLRNSVWWRKPEWRRGEEVQAG